MSRIPTVVASLFFLLAASGGLSHADFIRGDVNDDGSRDISDGISILLHLFSGAETPPCGKAADANDSGVVDISDAVAVFSFLFLGGEVLPAPEVCGPDPTPDGLSCVEYTNCTEPPGTVLEFGSGMRFLADASDPAIEAEWMTVAFDDSGWEAGSYGVGYDTAGGLGGLIATEVPPGTLSVYTRAPFQATDVDELGRLLLALDYDDGCAAWINGVEVFRSPEMPSGSLSWDTGADRHESSWDWKPDFSAPHDITEAGAPALKEGGNILAVGVWNSNGASNDLVLNVRLSVAPSDWAPPSISVVRGPYLQIGTPTSVIVRWRTEVAVDSEVRYGTEPDHLDLVASQPVPTTEHEVLLTGLSPDTVYHYSIGTTAEILAVEGQSFRTAPPRGSSEPMRIWVLGDSGEANRSVRKVRNTYYEFTGETPASFWMMLGDNAYDDGLDEEYQEAVFEVFPSMLKTTALWTTLGNHDNVDGDTQTGPYYDIFTLPTGGEAGGVPSGAEAYYSFDYANVHFVSLDSEETDRSAAAPMALWLRQDLAANDQPWTIAFFHSPPYSKGNHDSDVLEDMTEMRENFGPILEEGGVDLVLSGHSHSYERSYLLNGHYGVSSTLEESMFVDKGDGRPDDDGAYTKSPGPHQGTVYVVCGSSSGVTSNGTLDHPVMYSSSRVRGSLVLDIDDDQLSVVFVDEEGVVQDNFSMVSR